MTTSKTVTLGELRVAQQRDHKRIEKKDVGLYTITRTSEPIDIANLARDLAPGESATMVDEPLSRVKEWLNNIAANVAAIRSDNNQTESVKLFAERCSIPATRLLQLLNQMGPDSIHTAQFVGQAIEISAELADEWQSLKVNATLEKPVSRYRSSTEAALANTAKNNDKKKADAEQKAVAVFDKWKDNPSRRESLNVLTRPEQVKKFLKVGRPADRVARRLRAMLKDGRIK